jgi:two-component system, response regulator PdtaR
MRLTVLLAFADARAGEAIARALTRSGVAVYGVMGDGASLLRAARKLGPCLVLMGPRLPDMTPQELHAALGGRAALRVLCRAGETGQGAEGGVRRETMPATGPELAALVRGMLAEEEERLRESVRRAAPDEDLVRLAKETLQRRMRCSEGEAHRALQRLSMARGLRMAEAARRVLEDEKTT